MAIVSKNLYHNPSKKNILFTYDDSLIDVSFTNNPYIKIEFVGNGYPKLEGDSGITMDRNNTTSFSVGEINTSAFIDKTTTTTTLFDSTTCVTGFTINLTLTVTTSVTINIDTDLLVGYVEPEPDPEPEPEVGVKVYYTKSDDLEVSYTDTYGTPKYSTDLIGYDLVVDLVVGDVLELVALNDKLIDTVTIQCNDEYDTPLPAYVEQVNDGSAFIDLEESMFSYGEVYFEVALVTEPEPEPEPETITSNIEYFGANYTTSFVEATSVTTIKGESLTFTAAAGSGYVFDGTSSTIEFTDIDYSTPLYHLTITVTQVGKTITITIPSLTLDEGVTIEINLNPTLEILPDVSSFINTYSVTSGELSQLATKRYATVNGEVLDYGNRITSLFRLPFEIDSTTPDTIKLGDIDTEVSTHLATDYLLRLSIGEVFVPEIYNNSLDYVNVNCTLYLPFLSSIELDSQQVINQTVSIEYVVNLFDGECTVNLYSTFTNQLFHSSIEKIGLDLPYSSGVNAHNPLFNIGSVKMNDIRLAYIEVERSVPSIVDNSLGVVIDEIGQLEDYVGYVEVENIDLHSKATISEAQEIKSLLRSGVYINE
jgi:hypothetical protein